MLWLKGSRGGVTVEAKIPGRLWRRDASWGLGLAAKLYTGTQARWSCCVTLSLHCSGLSVACSIIMSLSKEFFLSIYSTKHETFFRARPSNKWHTCKKEKSWKLKLTRERTCQTLLLRDFSHPPPCWTYFSFSSKRPLSTFQSFHVNTLTSVRPWQTYN